jgi:hypothetical protein
MAPEHSANNIEEGRIPLIHEQLNELSGCGIYAACATSKTSVTGSSGNNKLSRPGN